MGSIHAATGALIRSEPLTDDVSRRSVAALRAEVLAAVGRPDDVISSIAARSPMRLVCATLGVPRKDWARLSRLVWQGDERSMEALSAYADVMIADRCSRPTDDLTNDLVLADVDGEGLTADELRAIVVTLVAS